MDGGGGGGEVPRWGWGWGRSIVRGRRKKRKVQQNLRMEINVSWVTEGDSEWVEEKNDLLDREIREERR